MVDAIKGDIKVDENQHEHDQFEQDAKLLVDVNANSTKIKHEFDELVIVATAIVILVAGYDTTGTTLAFACYQLAKNPQIQDKLREEVLEVVGDNAQRDLTYDDLQSMTYVDQVFNEALRFYNPVGILQRSVTQKYKMPGHDLVLEKDAQVWINVMALHTDPKHYANPYEFDPEHFSKEAKAARNP